MYYLNRVQPYPDENVPDHPGLQAPGRRVEPGVDASKHEIRRALAAYYGMVDTVDDLFGRVLETLEHVGEDPDEWVIIYTSDHGDMLGEHGIWEKSVFYEGSVRVPLIVRWPSEFESHQVDDNVNLCDLYATLCDLADVPLPSNDGLDSRSLTTLLRGAEDDRFDETVSGMGGDVMIKDNDLKYQYYAESDSEVLFDLDRDPKETTNFINDSEYAETVVTFRERRNDLGYGPDADPEASNAEYMVLP